MRVVILAGGGGTRLWPLSREDFPKQFLKFGSLSLLQTTVQRLARAPFIKEVLIATNAHHLPLVQEQLRRLQLPQKVQILLEPARRNTAPAIALAVKYLEQFSGAGKTDPILVLPSDHLIQPESIFLDTLEQMEEMARKKWIITFGIRPTKAETGYGYIEIGQKKNASAYEAVRFVEKPDFKKAASYFADPNFYWNSGMFLFSVETFWKQLELHAPAIFSLSSSYQTMLDQFSQMPDLSIDYAVMEKSKEILVCPMAVQWSDVGSWDSVYDAMDKDQNQNVKIGHVHDVDTQNSLIIGGKRLISTIGVTDLLVVDTEDALFVSKKGESQRVKALVQELIKKGKKESAVHKMQTHPWGISHLLDEEYEIRKIQLNPHQKLEGEKAIPLKGQPVIKEGWIINESNESIEFLLIG